MVDDINSHVNGALSLLQTALIRIGALNEFVKKIALKTDAKNTPRKRKSINVPTVSDIKMKKLEAKNENSTPIRIL